MPSATRSISSACGFSEEISEDMNSKRCSSARGFCFGVTLIPPMPQTMRMPALTSSMGIVRAAVPSLSTRMPQSISGLATSSQCPPTRTRVGKFVVE
jgi:hypothetical protein